MAQRHAERDLGRDRTEGRRHPLPDRLERRPAINDLRDVPAHHLGRVVIDRAEEPAPALALGIEARRVRAPHLVRAHGNDRPRVRSVAVLMTRSARGEQMVLAHQAQHTLAPDPDVLGAQPEVHLAMPFAVKWAGRQDGTDRLDELVVPKHRLRAALPGLCG